MQILMHQVWVGLGCSISDKSLGCCWPRGKLQVTRYRMRILHPGLYIRVLLGVFKYPFAQVKPPTSEVIASGAEMQTLVILKLPR